MDARTKTKVEQIALSDIIKNPWRDTDLFPLDEEHVGSLRDAMKEFDFHQTPTGRWRNDKLELACGHARTAAAKKARLDSIPVVVGDYSDDDMLRLMTDENALQSGANPGAVMNEVAAVTRRLIEVLWRYDNTVSTSKISPVLKEAFEDKTSIGTAHGRLISRLDDSTKDLPLGYKVLARYLGHGDPKRSHRSQGQLREALNALKQSGRYDQIVDDAIRAYAPPAPGPVSNKKTIIKTVPSQRATPILDDRTAHLFPNEHQFAAFREAITSPTARKVIPVEKQMDIAKAVMDPMLREGFSRKQVGAPFIRSQVQSKVQEAMKAQRAINKEERDRYLMEQVERQVDDILSTATGSVRSLGSAINKIVDLIKKHPGLEMHPKLSIFSTKLDNLVGFISDLSKAIK